MAGAKLHTFYPCLNASLSIFILENADNSNYKITKWIDIDKSKSLSTPYPLGERVGLKMI